MSNPIIEAALAERVQTCVAAGLCQCNEYGISPTCPCHTVQAVANTPEEQAIAPNIINIERNEEET